MLQKRKELWKTAILCLIVLSFELHTRVTTFSWGKLLNPVIYLSMTGYIKPWKNISGRNKWTLYDSEAVNESGPRIKRVIFWLLLQLCEVNEPQLTRKLNTSEKMSDFKEKRKLHLITRWAPKNKKTQENSGVNILSVYLPSSLPTRS